MFADFEIKSRKIYLILLYKTIHQPVVIISIQIQYSYQISLILFDEFNFDQNFLHLIYNFVVKSNLVDVLRLFC